MLLHIRPQLLCPFREASLIDLEIKALGIHLVGGVDLATRRPYPNKHYKVACRKRGHKAIDGILIETEKPVDGFVYIARWAIAAEFCAHHRVDYRVLDHDFDAASDSMLLWHACCEELGGWSSRVPEAKKTNIPTVGEPVMEVVAENVDRRRSVEDVIEGGWIVRRHQKFEMPTIEPERIVRSRFDERMPSLDMAFRSA